MKRMDLHHTGFEEVLFSDSERVSISIKKPVIQSQYGCFASSGQQKSSINVQCKEYFRTRLNGNAATGSSDIIGRFFLETYQTTPLFYDQQEYLVVVKGQGDCIVSFGNHQPYLCPQEPEEDQEDGMIVAVLNFGTDVGHTDLVIDANGKEYFRISFEVFPSGIKYQRDYQEITDDVNREISSLAFDFLKGMYLGYQQGSEAHNSHVEFISVLWKIYQDFLRAADRVLVQPNHGMASTHEVLSAKAVRRIDRSSVRWAEKHPDSMQRWGQTYAADRTLAVRKQITYDTNENRFLYHLLRTTATRLQRFRRNYVKLHGEFVPAAATKLTWMVRGLEIRCKAPVFAFVTEQKIFTEPPLVFLLSSGYRELYKYYLMLQRGIGMSGEVFELSIKDLATLYEYWCFIKLNSLMRERYQLLSQNVIRVQGTDVIVSLARGEESLIRYRDPINGQTVTLSYEPAPGAAEEEEEKRYVLRLSKKGISADCDYLFDAAYPFAPVALKNGEDSADNEKIILAARKDREALVRQHSTDEKLHRKHLGVCVLFSSGEDGEREHSLCEGAEVPDVRALPFLPSATGVVTDLLDALLADVPGTMFEKAVLADETEQALTQTDWRTRDVLVGSLRNRAQLEVCLRHRFYHVPAYRIPDENLPIRYVAIYQSKTLFGPESGIRYYGEVTRCTPVLRKNIPEIPKYSDELYYRFDVREWRTLPKVISAKEVPAIHVFTTLFLLENSAEMPDLTLKTEEDFRFYSALKQALHCLEESETGEETGFAYRDAMIVFEGGRINAYQNRRIVSSYEIGDFSRLPGAVFHRIQGDLERNYHR